MYNSIHYSKLARAQGPKYILIYMTSFIALILLSYKTLKYTLISIPLFIALYLLDWGISNYTLIYIALFIAQKLPTRRTFQCTFIYITLVITLNRFRCRILSKQRIYRTHSSIYLLLWILFYFFSHPIILIFYHYLVWFNHLLYPNTLFRYIKKN